VPSVRSVVKNPPRPSPPLKRGVLGGSSGPARPLGGRAGAVFGAATHRWAPAGAAIPPLCETRRARGALAGRQQNGGRAVSGRWPGGSAAVSGRWLGGITAVAVRWLRRGRFPHIAPAYAVDNTTISPRRAV